MTCPGSHRNTIPEAEAESISPESQLSTFITKQAFFPKPLPCHSSQSHLFPSVIVIPRPCNYLASTGRLAKDGRTRFCFGLCIIKNVGNIVRVPESDKDAQNGKEGDALARRNTV